MPAWDLGSFRKAADVHTCLSFAKDSFARRGFKAFFADDGNYTVIGGPPDYSVFAQVTCVPRSDGSSWVIVTAYSDNGSLAEKTRNNVRSDIEAEVLIDQGSVGIPAAH
jgi:hypothetical protein